VAARAWERLGFARLGDYAGERAGMSARQLQELAAVDRALARLPALEAAFLAGRLSWSKVRDLCRVATPQDEVVWLEAALRLTARALEREVRAVDRRALGALEPAAVDEDGYAADEDRAAVVLHVSGVARAKWWRARQLAQRVAGERLSHAECAEAVAAEVLSAIALEGELAAPAVARVRAATALDEPAQAPPPPPAGEAPPSPFLDGLVDGLERADAHELDRRLRRAARLEQRLMAALAPELLEVARGRLYRGLGFAALDGWARERLGISPRKAQALLRLERAGQLCPELREAFRGGRLSWRAAHVLVPLIALEHAVGLRAAWVARAARVSLRRLEDEVQYALAHDLLDPHACARAMDGEASGPHACARSRAGRGWCGSSSRRRGTSRRSSAPPWPPSSAGSSAQRAAAPASPRPWSGCSTTRSRPGARWPRSIPGSTSSSRATASAARCRAAPASRSSRPTTCAGARRAAATRPGTSPRSAPGTTCAASTRARSA